MMTIEEVQQRLRIRLMGKSEDGDSFYRGALAAVAAALGDSSIEGGGGWYDYGAGNVANGLHIRVVATRGVITLDSGLPHDGLPDARLIPWSRVKAVRVTASAEYDVAIGNAWMETELGEIDFGGLPKSQLPDIVNTAQRHLR